MEAINGAILVGSILLLVTIFTSLIAFRFGAPLLLFFLGTGLAVGPDALGLIDVQNVSLTYFAGSVALAIILFESGFDTSWRSYKLASGPAMTLATAGVGLTTCIVAVAAHHVLDMPWAEALLLGAIVSSTDAAAVFLLLRVGGITLRDRVRSTLEIESGSNDPIAILLTLSLVEFVRIGSIDGHFAGFFLAEFVIQIIGGAIIGVLGGALLVQVINRIKLEEGLYPIFSLALALFVCTFATALEASGFLAVYIMGLVAGNAKLRGAQDLRHFHNGLAWLGQIVMFVMLGVLATPSDFPALFIPSAIIAAVLILVARPVAVWVCLVPFRFTANETTFIAWVGLRGAVSVLLALVPLLEDLPGGQTIFNVVFMVVIMSLTIQGWTVKPMAHWLRLIVPPRIGPVDRMELSLPGGSDYELVAYKIRSDSPVAKGLRLPRWARPSLILRDGKVQKNVHTMRSLQGADLVYVFVSRTRVHLLDRLFAGAKPITEDDTEFFGELVLNSDLRVGSLADMYGLPLTLSNADLTLEELFRADYRDSFEVGDRLRLGPVELIVRELDDKGITKVGLALEPTSAGRPRIGLFRRPDELGIALRSYLGRQAVRFWKYRQSQK